MKKSILKTTTIILISILLSFPVMNGCQKNVGDIYGYEPTILNPDFAIVNIDYSYDNDELNSDSWLTFKVTYKNNEVTDVLYPSVLSFYIDNKIHKSIVLEDIESDTEYEEIYEWAAAAGNHDFKFEINFTSSGEEFTEEANTGNNSQSTNLDIAVKQLEVVQEVVVETAVAVAIVVADTASGVEELLEAAGVTISDQVEVVETTYDDGTTMIEAAVENSDGTIDTTRTVVSISVNPGVTEGQQQQATMTMVVETNIEENEASLSNANNAMVYKDGELTLISLKSGKIVSEAGCTELSNFELFMLSEQAKQDLTDAMANLTLEDLAHTYITVALAYDITQGDVDNPPVISIFPYVEECPEECIDGYNNDIKYAGYTVTITDDRDGVKTIPHSAQCGKNWEGDYVYADCGGNLVGYVLGNSKLATKTEDLCGTGVHN